ncbi:MAG: type I pullulanase [Erysipelotrichaceae bacterium]
MRRKAILEAYLDDFKTINIYVSKNYYEGKIKSFFLSDESGKSYDLHITGQSTDHPTHNEYYCQLAEELVLNQKYYIYETHALSCPLEFALVSKKSEFDQRFYYEGPLGVIVNNDITTFHLWAPTATLVRVVIDESEVYNLQRYPRGLYKLTLNENKHLSSYYYLIEVNGKIKRTLDPYGLSSIENSKANAIIDLDKLNLPSKVSPSKANDTLIGEVSIRDFTKGLAIENRATFKGFTTSGLKIADQAVGFDYLVDLGITHVQIMPVNDFATVDELNPFRFYNWGYDPAQYFTLEGSYASDAKLADQRMKEFYHLVRSLHINNLKVIVDVVFNHVYDLATSPLYLSVPYYYFRYNDNSTLSNGSFCGNDLDSKALMMRRYIVDVLKFYVNFYDVDGFRFDLMGILDIDTMQLIARELQMIKPDIMLYGEGWSMPTALSDMEKASVYNADKLLDYGFFDDYFRDVSKGRSEKNHQRELGYLTGDFSKIEDFKNALCGNSPRSNVKNHQVIHYTECHDNYTLWDKIKHSCHLDSKELRIKKHKLVLASTMLAKGIFFFQLGQEFCRSKNGVDNSYNSSDDINMINWQRVVSYQEVVNYFKRLIRLRKAYPILTVSEVFNEFEVINNALLWSQSLNEQKIIVAINPSDQDIEKHYQTEVTVIFDGVSVDEYSVNTVVIKAYSIIIYSINH